MEVIWMPHQEQVTEKYWCPGPWPWEWFNTCTRTVIKWCYDFSYLTYDYHFVYTNYVGCEGNDLYAWRQFELSFSSGASTLYFITKCYNDQKERTGSCSPENAIAQVRKVLGSNFAESLNPE